MYNNVCKLQEFYSTTRGKLVSRVIRKRMLKMWSNARGDRIVGFGYPFPYVSSFVSQNAESIISLLPIDFVSAGDINNINQNIDTVVCTNNLWPIESNSVNRVVIVHVPDSDINLADILNEAWRVLVAEGRLLLVVPNRSGIWSRVDNNPFGHGTPYSMSQIKDLLKIHKFNPERENRALFFPPTESARFVLATSMIWENIGSNICNALGGVNIIEANKRVYANKSGIKIKRINHRKMLLPSGSIGARYS